jgi:hypothetical protein
MPPVEAVSSVSQKLQDARWVKRWRLGDTRSICNQCLALTQKGRQLPWPKKSHDENDGEIWIHAGRPLIYKLLSANRARQFLFHKPTEVSSYQAGGTKKYSITRGVFPHPRFSTSKNPSCQKCWSQPYPSPVELTLDSGNHEVAWPTFVEANPQMSISSVWRWSSYFKAPLLWYYKHL